MVIGRGKNKVRVEGILPVVYFREGEAFVAFSPAIDLSSYGGSFEEAKKNFREALDMLLEDLIKKDALEEVLAECGWERIERPSVHWIPPAYVGQESIKLSA